MASSCGARGPVGNKINHDSLFHPWYEERVPKAQRLAAATDWTEDVIVEAYFAVSSGCGHWSGAPTGVG